MFHNDKRIHHVVLIFPSLTRDGFPIERRGDLLLNFLDFTSLRIGGSRRPIKREKLGAFTNTSPAIDNEFNEDIEIYHADIDILIDVLREFFSLASELNQEQLAVIIDEELHLFRVKVKRTTEVEIVQ